MPLMIHRRGAPMCYRRNECVTAALRIAVAVPDQLQASQGEQVVHLVDLLAERHDRGGVPAGRDRGRLLAELLAQSAEDAVHLAGVAVHDPGLYRLLGALA